MHARLGVHVLQHTEPSVAGEPRHAAPYNGNAKPLVSADALPQPPDAFLGPIGRKDAGVAAARHGRLHLIPRGVGREGRLPPPVLIFHDAGDDDVLRKSS